MALAKEKYPEDSFGALLVHLIKKQGFTQTRFLHEMEISKTYLFDIFHGRVKAPNARMQLRMAELLGLSAQERAAFLDKAAEARGEVPADIWLMIQSDSALRAQIRAQIDETRLFTIRRGSE